MALFSFDWPALPPAACRGGVLTLGNFDGVHRGHQTLLTAARELGRSVDGPAIAVTFDPHPLALLRPQQFLPVLTTTAERAELLQAHGVEHVLIVRTSAALLQLDAVNFFQAVLRERLAARGMVEGDNFCFGRDRSGNIETLTELCGDAGLRLIVVPPLLHEGLPVSSSRVRNALTSGQVAEVTQLLGRPYRLQGVVSAGQQRGRTLGFPTANLSQVHTVVPAEGVYAVRVPLQGQVWPAAANIGPNPTFGEQARKIEIHLIGFAGDLYGQPLAVDFVERIRATRPFASVHELIAQLKQDIDHARSVTP